MLNASGASMYIKSIEGFYKAITPSVVGSVEINGKMKRTKYSGTTTGAKGIHIAVQCIGNNAGSAILRNGLKSVQSIG